VGELGFVCNQNLICEERSLFRDRADAAAQNDHRDRALTTDLASRRRHFTRAFAQLAASVFHDH
jgi:hypothetical protein